MTDDVAVVECLVALDDDLADGDAPPLVDIEHEGDGPVGVRDLGQAWCREIVALPAVQGVDRGERAVRGRPVERPSFAELDLPAYAARRDLLGTAHCPAHEEWAFHHFDAQDLPAVDGTLRDAYVVELPCGEQRLDGALHVTVGDLLPQRDACQAPDLGGGNAVRAEHLDAVDHCRDVGFLRRQDRGRRG